MTLFVSYKRHEAEMRNVWDMLRIVREQLWKLEDKHKRLLDHLKLIDETVPSRAEIRPNPTSTSGEYSRNSERDEMTECLKCPKCGSLEVATTAEQMFMVNTGYHHRHSVKAHDSDSKATCLDCRWVGHRAQLEQTK